MLDTLVTILVVLLVIVVVIGAIVLTIVRFANRMERRLRRLTGGAGPRRSRAPKSRRSPSSSRRTAPRSPSAAAARPATRRAPSPAPTLRIRPLFEPKPEMKWHGEGATLRLHERAILSPLAYAAGDKRASGAPLDPSEIIASLPVSPRGVPGAPPDWPSYARLTPEQRSVYLAWLANGRASLPPAEAYLVLHFLGLERRALADGADLALIVREVCRVRDLVARAMAAPDAAPGAPRDAGPRRLASFTRQSGAFLWTLVALRPAAFTERDLRVLASRTSSWSEEALVSALAWFARSPADPPATGSAPASVPTPGRALPAWLARIVVENLPGARRSVVIDRLPDRFAALFDVRFGEIHPAGMALRVAKRERTMSYRPSNDTLAPVEAPVPDAMGIASQFTPLIEIWNSCIDDLRGLARLAEPGTPLTLAQWTAMPEDLRAQTDNPFAPALAALAAANADASGHAITTLGELAAACRMAEADRPTLTPSQCRTLAQTIQDAGMAIEPDPRVTASGGPRDAAVALCATPIPIEQTPEATARYLAAACILRLGAAVALADGQADERELEPIKLELERAFDLSEHEHRRLDALMALLTARGSAVRSVGKRLLSALSPDARRSVGRLLVAVASADGVVGESERATLRTSYRALGLEASDLDVALDSLAAPTADRADTAGPDRAPGQGPPAMLQLDRDAIARIMAETREVAQILADAMRGEENEHADDPGERDPSAGGAQPAPSRSVTPVSASAQIDAAASPPSPGSSPTPIADPPARYAGFFAAIMARSSWPIADASALARAQGLMLSGAIEAINDWSYDRAGGALLIEDADRVVVDADRLRIMGIVGGS